MDEVGPESVLLRGRRVVGQGDIDNTSWHLVDAVRALTWCGLDIGYGARRRLWTETPENERCLLCISRLRGAPAR